MENVIKKYPSGARVKFGDDCADAWPVDCQLQGNVLVCKYNAIPMTMAPGGGGGGRWAVGGGRRAAGGGRWAVVASGMVMAVAVGE